MPSMFPSPLRGDAGSPTPADPSAKPKALLVAYYLAVASAIVLILSGLVLFTTQAPGGADAEMVQAVSRNQRFMAIVNIVGGLMIAALASQFHQAGRVTRRVYLGLVVVLIALNLIAVMLRVGGLVLMIIALMLALSAMAYFQQTVSTYIDHRVRS
ncbi:hypothetical protein [Corynebacterium vitaeruminis]|uniref:hypothetical protein n=1 Tax=Corynebacterium vitaeruminis TaxID=38305 RepID=UPI0028B1772D|nr:hypothetical protein [Corynebacterium vitaeruminis]